MTTVLITRGLRVRIAPDSENLHQYRGRAGTALQRFDEARWWVRLDPTESEPARPILVYADELVAPSGVGRVSVASVQRRVLELNPDAVPVINPGRGVTRNPDR